MNASYLRYVEPPQPNPNTIPEPTEGKGEPQVLMNTLRKSFSEMSRGVQIY